MKFPALEAVKAELKQIFDEAGPELDLSKVTCVPGGKAAVLARVRELNAECEQLDEVTKAVNKGPAFLEGDSRPRGSRGSRSRSIERAFGELGVTFGDEGVRSLQNRAMHALDVLDAPDEGLERVEEMIRKDATGNAARVVVAGADPDYLRAFAKLVVDPANGHRGFSDDELRAYQRAGEVKNAIAIGTDNTGGFLVPTYLDPAIQLTSDGVVDPIRAMARLVTIATDTWHGVSSAGVSAEWVAESVEVADASPTLGGPSIATHKADVFVPYSIEAEMDAMNLVEQLRMLMLDAKAVHEATAWISGNGTTQPKGIITALDGSASEVAPATAETFAAADVYATLEALPARFRPNARWAAALGTINDIDQFETTNGAKKFPGVADANPTLLRRPLAEVSNMDSSADINAAATADHHILLVGDWRNYVIVDRIGATVEIIPHLVGANRRPTLQRGLILYWRTGADVVVANGFRVLNVATTA